MAWRANTSHLTMQPLRFAAAVEISVCVAISADYCYFSFYDVFYKVRQLVV